MLHAIKQWTERNRDRTEATWRELRQKAEVSWEEKETTAYLCGELERIGFTPMTFADQTGAVAVWDEGVAGPTVALRADMDALPHWGDGRWQAVHSCGHDAHMTMVLHSVLCLRACGFKPKGRVKLLLQPAEEKGEGARSFLAKGVVDDVDAMLGIHLRPVQEMPFGQASAAIYHGASAKLRGTIRGVQAHAARPHLGINAVDSLAAVIHAVNAIRMDPSVRSSAQVTAVSAGGEALNVIPDRAEFGIDLRAQTNEAMDELVRKVQAAVHAAGRANGAETETAIASRMVAAVPHPPLESLVEQAIGDVLGEDGVRPPVQTSGSEDFHYYALEKKNMAATMIGLGADLRPGLHHPDMTFRLAALPLGVAIMAQSVVRLFEQSGVAAIQQR